MTKLTLFLMSICMAAVVEQCAGFNYYWPYPGSQDIMAIPQFAPIQGLWPPPVENCDKKENIEEGSSESSSSESSSSESSESSSSESSESSSESKGSKESGEEKGSKEEGSKEESKSSSEEEEGSSSSEEGEKKEGSGEGSGEKKEEPKKKKKKESKEPKPIFPARYIFPQRQAALFAPSSSYALMPYRTSFVVQQPPTTYPVKSNYQYVLPSSSAVLGGYGSPITYSRLISSPVAKLAYSAPTLGYPTVARAYVAAPRSGLYSMPATSLAYIKK